MFFTKVNAFNKKVYCIMSGAKYSIKAHDNSMRLENRLKRFPYNQPNKTSQLYTVLNLAEGEGTDIPMNVRTGDGLTNGADNVIKLVHLHLIIVQNHMSDK